MSEVSIRPAGPADLGHIVNIEQSAFSVPWRDDTFAGLLNRTDVDFLVAVRAGGSQAGGGRVVGYAVFWSSQGQGELANIAVDPAHRGRGIGSELVRAVLDRAEGRTARRIYLEVRASNDAAATLYERFGFREIGVRKSYYREPVEDARVLALDVSSATRPG